FRSPPRVPKPKWPRSSASSNHRCAKPQRNLSSKKPLNSATAFVPSRIRISLASSAANLRRFHSPPPTKPRHAGQCSCSGHLQVAILVFCFRSGRLLRRAVFLGCFSVMPVTAPDLACRPSHNPAPQLLQRIKRLAPHDSTLL